LHRHRRSHIPNSPVAPCSFGRICNFASPTIFEIAITAAGGNCVCRKLAIGSVVIAASIFSSGSTFIGFAVACSFTIWKNFFTCRAWRWQFVS
jgi:hypothetical protein